MISTYILIFVIIEMAVLISVIKPQYEKVCYCTSLIVLTLFLALRFGQGTDYPGYMCIYEYAETALNPELGFLHYLNNIHAEAGWKLLMVTFKLFNAEFWVVTFWIAIFTMFCTHRCIDKYCLKYKTLALVLLYPTIYLTYYFSGIRQGFAMAFFYGFLVEKLLNKKYMSYVVGVLLISTIHKSSVFYLILPIALMLNKTLFGIGFILSVLLAVAMVVDPIQLIIREIAVSFGISSDYFNAIAVSWISLAERVLMMMLVVVMWLQNSNKKIQERALPFLKIYLTGFLLYICLCSNSFISSRLAIMFKMAEIVLIPILLEGKFREDIKRIFVIIFLMISFIMMYKNLNYYSEVYHDNIGGYNLPYVSIFNQEEILNYRAGARNSYYNFDEKNYIVD